MGTCFVIMPFGGYFDGYYSNVLRPAILDSGLSPVRADEIYGAGVIIEDIHRAILSADICIADVTGRNPNVAYELGMAHAVQKPVVLITQDVKDVPFDYRHLRLITYDPKTFGWETNFRKSVSRTIAEIRKNPSANLALKAAQTDVESMRQHLKKIFYATAYDLERTNHIYCDERGNALIKTSWVLIARSPVFHLCHNLVLDKPGQIEVRRVFDRLNARDLEHLPLEKSDTHLSYFFFFKQFKNVGQHFEVETEVYAEYYFDLDRFVSTGRTMMSTQAVAEGIRYIRRSDLLYLPKLSKFAGVYAEYYSHPRPDRIGSRVDAVESDEHYLLTMVYDSEQPYQQETAASLHLPRS